MTVIQISDFKNNSKGQPTYKVSMQERIKDVCGSLSISPGRIGQLMDLFYSLTAVFIHGGKEGPKSQM